MQHRLPREILPHHYKVEIEPDIANGTFRGHVIVEAQVVEPTTTLVCNCADLDLSDVRIDGEAVKFSLDAASERLIVELGNERATGPIELRASFDAEMNDKLKGFYRSTFLDDDGVEQTIATTQLQSTDARRAFPCWDEPDFKAAFSITLVVDSDLTAISNGAEIARTGRPDGKVAVDFAKTMVMSTYLVAFIAGPLEISETAYARDVPVRIIHRPGQGNRTAFALEVAVSALKFFEDYYGIPYPADKLDMVALPDFAMGAMENVGCVTYREVLLLVDPDTATQPELQNVADVVNHEIAHMWFGNLVTMGWWNGIWLNEAFATFMELKATDAFRPEWERWTSFGISRSEAFGVDSLAATRPIEYPVVSPEDAEAMFDLLTYEKGAAVVRMLEQWLGEDTFKEGIGHYLRRHSLGNTETHDLWDALEDVAGRPVRQAMETWIFQGGYPVVTLTADGIEQRRFTYTDLSDDASWYVPVHVRSTDGSSSLVELSKPSAPLLTPAAHVETLNAQGRGFYRVNLGPERLAQLGEVGTSHLPAIERFGLVDDTWALTLAGQTELVDYVRLVDGYADERDVSVWQRIIGTLGTMYHLAPDDALSPLADWTQRLVAEPRDELGMSPDHDEADRVRQLRGALFATAGTIGADDAARPQAHEILAQEEPDAELLSAAVRIIAHSGTDADFDSFRQKFEDADSPQDQIRYLYALSAFPEAHHLDQVAMMALDGSIRSQSAPFVLAQALSHRTHGPAIWRVIEENWDTVNALFPSNTIVRMLQGIRALSDPATAGEVVAFFEGRPLRQGQKQLDQHLERLGVNRRFRTRIRSQLLDALR